LELAARNGEKPEFVRHSWDTAKRIFGRKKQKTLGEWH